MDEDTRVDCRSICTQKSSQVSLRVIFGMFYYIQYSFSFTIVNMVVIDIV